MWNFKLREGWCPALDISRAGTLLVLLNRNIRGNEKTLYREEDELDTLSWERTHSVQRQRGDMSLKLRSRCTFNLIFRFTLFYILCFVQFNRICFLFCECVCCAVLGEITILDWCHLGILSVNLLNIFCGIMSNLSNLFRELTVKQSFICTIRHFGLTWNTKYF